MAVVKKRGKKYCVIYKVKDETGKYHQKWETYATKMEAETRRKEVEYRIAVGNFEVPKCARLQELLEEYIKIYGSDKWSVTTYSGNVSLINNYIPFQRLEIPRLQRSIIIFWRNIIRSFWICRRLTAQEMQMDPVELLHLQQYLRFIRCYGAAFARL